LTLVTSYEHYVGSQLFSLDEVDQLLIKTIEENRKYEYEQMEKMWHKNRNYQSDLAGQIDYYQRLRQQAYKLNTLILEFH
jgi:hypothetical protein